MEGQQAAQREGQGTGFAYFMIRVQRHVPEDPHRVSGMIERLGTGEKWTFRDSAELLELLGAWPGGRSKKHGERDTSHGLQGESP